MATQENSESTGNQLAMARAEPRTISDLMKAPKTITRFQQIMPRHLSAERMLRVCSMAINNTPALAQCEPISLLGAMLACASFGLEPNTPLGHAYLIPFKKSTKQNGKWVDVYQVQLIIGYRGYIDLARRSGNMISIHADVVYDGDDFSFEYGSHQHLRHVPKGVRTKRSKLWAYAHAKLSDGEAFEVLPYAQVMDIRNGSQGYQAALKAKEEAENDSSKKWRMKSYDTTPWVAHEHEMAAKTMIRRLSKYLPMSLEFATALATDASADRGTLDLTAIAENPQGLMDGTIVNAEESDEIPAEDGQIPELQKQETQAGDSQPSEGAAAKSNQPAAEAKSGVDAGSKPPASTPDRAEPKKAEAKEAKAGKKPAARPKALFDQE